MICPNCSYEDRGYYSDKRFVKFWLDRQWEGKDRVYSCPECGNIFVNRDYIPPESTQALEEDE